MKFTHAALSLLLLAPTSLLAQEKAVTESGKKILVFPDGTWKQDTEGAGKEASSAAPSSPAAAKVKASINRGKSAILYDPKKWTPKGAEDNGQTEFEHVAGDGFAMVFAERLELSFPALKNLALSNAKEAAPDAEITFEEMRKVNGKDVLVLRMKGTISEIAFVYYGYYYTGKEGTLQVLTYTTPNLFDELKSDFEEFLNGLMITL